MLPLEAQQALPVTTGRPDDLQPGGLQPDNPQSGGLQPDALRPDALRPDDPQQPVLRSDQSAVPRFAGCQHLRTVAATAIPTESYLGLQSAEGTRLKWQF